MRWGLGDGARPLERRYATFRDTIAMQGDGARPHRQRKNGPRHAEGRQQGQ